MSGPPAGGSCAEAKLVLAELVADLAFDDFAQGDVFWAELFEGLDEGAATTAELLDAAGHHVDEQVGVGDDFVGFSEIIVTHGMAVFGGENRLWLGLARCSSRAISLLAARVTGRERGRMTLMIGWTTVATVPDAEQLARGLVERGLAVCAQVDAPMRAFYRWEGKVEEAVEARIWVKFFAEQSYAVEEWVLANHPYETPQWVVVRAEIVAEKYLSWARSSPSNLPL